MRIAAWNVNSLRARLPRVEAWLAAVCPEVVCLQETKLNDGDFPSGLLESMGYRVAHHGQGRWNGVAVCSRVGLEDVTAGFDDGQPPDPDARLVWATCGGVRVASVYVPNGRALDADHYQYKLAWLRRLRGCLEERHDPSEKLVLAGDFNVAPSDMDVWDIDAFAGLTHVSEPERIAWRDLCEWGLEDVFRLAYPGIAGLYTFWDYQGGRFHKRQGMRIDHILATATLAREVEGIIVDRNARKGPKPSDHAPVVADFRL